MNALLALSAVAPSTRSFWLMFADEVGMRPEFTCVIGGDWSHFSNETLLGLLRAAYPSLTVTWCDWAERPRDFAINGPVLLAKVLGEKGIPPRDVKDRRSSAEKYKRRRVEQEEHWDAGEVRSYKGRIWDGVHARRGAETQVAAPADTSIEVVVKCCGIHHTRASYDSLELLGASDRTEGFTAIHEERRACGCCKAVLVVITKRLLAEGR